MASTQNGYFPLLWIFKCVELVHSDKAQNPCRRPKHPKPVLWFTGQEQVPLQCAKPNRGAHDFSLIQFSAIQFSVERSVSVDIPDILDVLDVLSEIHEMHHFLLQQITHFVSQCCMTAKSWTAISNNLKLFPLLFDVSSNIPFRYVNLLNFINL